MNQKPSKKHNNKGNNSLRKTKYKDIDSLNARIASETPPRSILYYKYSPPSEQAAASVPMPSARRTLATSD